MPEVHFHHFSGLGFAAHYWSHRWREVSVDVAPPRGLGVLHPAPSLDLVSARVERVAPAILAAALLVIYLLELVLRWQFSLRVQPSLLPGEFQHPADHSPMLAGLTLDRLDRLLHSQLSHDVL